MERSNYRHSNPQIHCQNHPNKPLDMICIDSDCEGRGVYCKICQYSLHSQHKECCFPYERFWYEVNELVIKKKQLIYGKDMDDLFETKNRINGWLNEISSHFHEIVKQKLNFLNNTYLQFNSYIEKEVQACESLLIPLTRYNSSLDDVQGTLITLISRIQVNEDGDIELERFGHVEEIMRNALEMMSAERVVNEQKCYSVLNAANNCFEEAASTESSNNSNENEKRETNENSNETDENEENQIRTDSLSIGNDQSNEKDEEDECRHLNVLKERNAAEPKHQNIFTKPPISASAVKQRNSQNPINFDEDKENINGLSNTPIKEESSGRKQRSQRYSIRLNDMLILNSDKSKEEEDSKSNSN